MIGEEVAYNHVRHAYWISHAGQLILVAPEHLRTATPEERSSHPVAIPADLGDQPALQGRAQQREAEEPDAELVPPSPAGAGPPAPTPGAGPVPPPSPPSSVHGPQRPQNDAPRANAVAPYIVWVLQLKPSMMSKKGGK